MNKKENNWKYKIGDRIVDDKRDLTIIEQIYLNDNKGYKVKYYKYKCNKCGFDCGEYYDSKDGEYKNEKWIIEYGLYSEKRGCSCCCGNSNIVVKGINDIATTNPELVKYFIDINDAYKYTYSSNKRVLLKCPECGYEKEMKIYNLYKNGFSCPKCSDGVSYPEKFMINLLKQLNMDFVTQYSKTNAKWCGKYRYDFYFKKDNEEYIVETHGEQHYRNKTKFEKTLEEEQENDKNKMELAISNGIKPQNYIVIDCRYSELEFIKNNILHSRLNDIFDLDGIDWIKIGQDSEKSLVKEVCDYWYLHNEINNEGLTTTEVSKIFNICKHTTRSYLKKGTKFGWCNYNPEEEIKSNNIKNKIKCNRFKKKVEIFKNGVSLGVFDSMTELERKSEELFGIYLNHSNIAHVCVGKSNSYKGFHFSYVD